MPKYQVAYNPTTRAATIQPENDALPEDSILVGTFDHDEETDPLDSSVNHVMFHHVRDIFYKRSAANPAEEAMFPNNITDIHNITINWDAVANPLPINTEAPEISGTEEVGETLTANDGTWTNASTYAHQWQRADNEEGPWEDIAGATSTSYTLVSDDLDHYIRVVVTATGTNGDSTATSSPVGPIAAGE